MDQKAQSETLLSGYRAFDLADEKGMYCGKILGDLGVDVIKVEKPGGDLSRNMGPFYHDIPDPEKSLFWYAYNTSKRGITLSIETVQGQEIFKRLVATADFVIESFPPGYLDRLGLSYSVLSQINPRLILISITPFGQSGPYKDYKASDITIMAMGGEMYQAGAPDGPPLRCSVEQSYPQAGAQAAAAAMIAHYYRELTGEGQHIDVSMQECIVCTLWFVQQFWDLQKFIVKREGAWLTRGTTKRRTIFPCKDGYVVWWIAVARTGARTRALMEWMDSEGVAGDLKQVDWESIDYNQVTLEQQESWEKAFGDFFLTQTKAKLYEEAVKRNILLAPVNSTEEILQDAQLKERQYWVMVEHPELGASLMYPGAAFKVSGTPWRISRRAPLVGEYNEEVYGELGLSKKELVTLKRANVI